MKIYFNFGVFLFFLWFCMIVREIYFNFVIKDFEYNFVLGLGIGLDEIIYLFFMKF